MMVKTSVMALALLSWIALATTFSEDVNSDLKLQFADMTFQYGWWDGATRHEFFLVDELGAETWTRIITINNYPFATRESDVKTMFDAVLERYANSKANILDKKVFFNESTGSTAYIVSCLIINGQFIEFFSTKISYASGNVHGLTYSCNLKGIRTTDHMQQWLDDNLGPVVYALLDFDGLFSEDLLRQNRM